jgi:hypothetical protein
MPPNAKTTTSRPAAIPLMPLGMRPLATCVRPGLSAGVQPSRKATPRMRKRTTKATLMKENQNSNSPKFLTPHRLIHVKTTMNTSA